MAKSKVSIIEALDGVRNDLLAVCSSKMREGQARYFKERVTFLGCSVSQCSRIAGEWFKKLKAEGWTYDDVLLLAEELLRRNTFEEGAVGLELVQRHKKEFREADFDTFERWLREYVNNWAHTDSMAPHIVGELVKKFPSLTLRIFEWTKSGSRWLRRAAAVTYVIHARHGRFHDEVFRTADTLLGDEDDLVQKGVGWMLKCASQADESAVVKYLMRNKTRTTRLVLRYATEKVSQENRRAVLS